MRLKCSEGIARRWGEPLSTAQRRQLETAFKRAVERRNCTAVRELLLRGADCEELATARRSALAAAIGTKDLVTACLLVDAGAAHDSVTRIADLVHAGFGAETVAKCQQSLDDARSPTSKAARLRDESAGPKVIHVSDDAAEAVESESGSDSDRDDSATYGQTFEEAAKEMFKDFAVSADLSGASTFSDPQTIAKFKELVRVHASRPRVAVPSHAALASHPGGVLRNDATNPKVWGAVPPPSFFKS